MTSKIYDHLFPNMQKISWKLLEHSCDVVKVKSLPFITCLLLLQKTSGEKIT